MGDLPTAAIHGQITSVLGKILQRKEKSIGDGERRQETAPRLCRDPRADVTRTEAGDSKAAGLARGVGIPLRSLPAA